MDVLRAAGCSNMAMFLRDMGNLVEPARYESFKTGLKKIGVDEAKAIGSCATIEAGLCSSRAAEKVYVSTVRAWVNDHGGTLPTRQTSHRLLLQVDPRVEVPDSVRRQNELAELRAENAKLRAENNSLKRKLEKMEKSIKKVAA